MELEDSYEENTVISREKLEGNRLDVQETDQPLEQIKSLNISDDNGKKNNDNQLNDLGDSMKGGRILDSKAQEEKFDANVQHNDSGKKDNGGYLNSKAELEKLDDKLDKMDEIRDSESKIVENAASGKAKEGIDLESNSQGKKLDNKSNKIDESRDLKSKSQGENLDSKLGKTDDNRSLESKQVENDDLGKLEDNRNLKSKSEGEKSDHKLARSEESSDLKYKSHGEKLDDKLGKIGETKDLESKSQEEKLDDDLDKMDETRDLKYKSQGEKLNDNLGKIDESGDLKSKSRGKKLDNNLDKIEEPIDLKSKSSDDKLGKIDESGDFGSKTLEEKPDNQNKKSDSVNKKNVVSDLDTRAQLETDQNGGGTMSEEEKEQEPIFDGTEIPGMETNRSASSHSLDPDSEAEGSAWPEKAAALKNFVKERGVVAVSTFLRRLSGKRDEKGQEVSVDESKVTSVSSKESEATEASQKMMERSSWNPLNYLKMSSDVDGENKAEQREQVIEEPLQSSDMKGRIILYTRLGCKDCKEFRIFLRQKRLRYVEINIDIYPGRKLELEKMAGSSAVPKVFFNEILIGGLSELKGLDESGKLDEKINHLITETPSSKPPLPPLSGEDDMSTSGAIDELALFVLKMKDSVVIKDRFYKMRWFTSCFLGSEAVNFISEDQYLEREEAVEFGRKLASKLFFQHVLDENLFEDGNHLYRFLDHDPIVSSQCHNIPRGLIDAKPKPITEIASRLRYLSYAIFEAYVSEDGRHVDYTSIHGSEEFARYIRTVQELQRVELQGISREEKLAFFINLYNMMAIHAILLWGQPAGPLERRKLFGDFKYVIGGCTYSLSAIQNGILRGNQRPPYNLMKPFGAKDKRSQVALPYPEPSIHFALVCGTRSGPPLRCYSPGNIDKELLEAAGDFLRGGGFVVELQAKVASVSKILKWFSVDFGKNETEVVKHASNYLEPTDSETLMELLSNSQLKVIYQPYDWALNS